jgi:hypothetical protein
MAKVFGLPRSKSAPQPAASPREALQRYQLTEEEYRSWERAFEQHGLAGLRSTRLQQYRGPRPPRGPRSRR